MISPSAIEVSRLPGLYSGFPEPISNLGLLYSTTNSKQQTASVLTDGNTFSYPEDGMKLLWRSFWTNEVSWIVKSICSPQRPRKALFLNSACLVCATTYAVKPYAAYSLIRGEPMIR